jgi:hypothetical protein
MDLRPAQFSACDVDLPRLASPVDSKSRAPKGRRFAHRRATPWLPKTPMTPPSSHPSVIRPNGPTVLLLRRGTPILVPATEAGPACVPTAC